MTLPSLVIVVAAVTDVGRHNAIAGGWAASGGIRQPVVNALQRKGTIELKVDSPQLLKLATERYGALVLKQKDDWDARVAFPVAMWPQLTADANQRGNLGLTYEARDLHDRVRQATARLEKKKAEEEAKRTGGLPPATIKILKRLADGLTDQGSQASILKAYAALGVRATGIPSADRYGQTWTIEGLGDPFVSRRLWGFLPPMGPFGGSQPDSRPAAKAWFELRSRAAEAIGATLPEKAKAEQEWLEEHGFARPSVPKERRHGNWTCGYCWRNIAVTDDGVMVHHGYQRPGHGYIIGDCRGVSYKPFERGTKATERKLEDTDNRAWSLTIDLRRGWTQLPALVLEDGKWVEGVVEPGQPGWERAEAAKREEVTYELRYLWSGKFNTVPWLRAAIRTWTREEMGAVGAPEHLALVAADFVDKPVEAG